MQVRPAGLSPNDESFCNHHTVRAREVRLDLASHYVRGIYA